jgi:hypothetical protein
VPSSADAAPHGYTPDEELQPRGLGLRLRRKVAHAPLEVPRVGRRQGMRAPKKASTAARQIYDWRKCSRLGPELVLSASSAGRADG